MKELQAGIQLVRSKCIQMNRHPAFKKKVIKPAQTSDRPKRITQADCPKHNAKSDQQKVRFSLPFGLPLEVLRQRTTEGLRRLKAQGTRINQLSAELEEAILEFKAIASDVNRDWKTIQAIQEPTSAIADICEYQTANVPNVLQKPSGSLILTSRTVDLFKAEREAALLARTLRHRAKRKQLKG